MITFSIFLPFSVICKPLRVYYFTFYSTASVNRIPAGGEPILFPAVDGVAELEEGDHAERDREPEGDQPEDEDRGEDGVAGVAEEDEGADHAGVDRPHPRGRQREEVGDHAEEEALDDDGERDVDAEGVEGGPEDPDARRPVAGGAEHRQPPFLGMRE